jgi:trk system potassium uptake protein TrkA
VSSLRTIGLVDADVVAAVTGDDEDNLVISLLAKQEFAVPRVVARVNHPTNEWLFDEQWGVDLAVSPPHLLTSLVEEEVSTGDLVSIIRLQRGQVELVEVRLDERSPAIDKRVEDLDLPSDVTLVAVVREGHVTPCRGTTPLTAGDEVLALCASGRVDELRKRLVGGDDAGSEDTGSGDSGGEDSGG